jgi:proteasome activator subunit 4
LTILTTLLLQSILTILPVLTSFLPPFNIRTYVPVLFHLWQAFNSSAIDDRLLDLMSDLAEDNIENDAEWKDVGIWTHDQWRFMAAKMLESMS